jgi:hypothetical protein
MKNELGAQENFAYKCDTCGHIFMDRSPDDCPECHSVDWHEYRFPVVMEIHDTDKVVDLVVENTSDSEAGATIGVGGAGIYFEFDNDAINELRFALTDVIQAYFEAEGSEPGTSFLQATRESFDWADWFGFKGDGTDPQCAEEILQEAYAFQEQMANGEAIPIPENLPTVKDLEKAFNKVYLDGVFYDREDVDNLLARFS